MCTMWNLDKRHVYTVKLFHSCCQLHLQDRVQTNKVFHTRLVLTVNLLLCRSVIGSLSPTYRGKTGEVSANYSRLRRPQGHIAASYIQNLHYITVISFILQSELYVFLILKLVNGHMHTREARSLLHGAARWQKAVVYHNYASGPISWDPLAVILECAVVLSAFNVEREMGRACQEL